MCIKYFLFLIFSINFCLTFGKIDNEEYVDQPNENSQQDIIIQFEDKMKALFTMWKTETNRKLESIELMIPDLQENINRKLFGLRSNILEKLEEYIDDKLNNLEISIPQKIKQYMNCNLEFVDNKTVEKFEDSKLNALAKNISYLLEKNNNCNSEAVKRITDLDEKINKKIKVLDEKLPPKYEENIGVLDALVKNITNEFAENINSKSDVLKKITDFQDNMNRKLEILDEKIPKKIEENIKLKFDALAKNISKELDENNCKCNSLNNVTAIEDNNLQKLPTTISPVEKTTEIAKQPCKEELVPFNQNTPEYYMNSEDVNHVTLKRNSLGHRTYFELHFAVETGGALGILLSDQEQYWASGIQYTIWVREYSDQYTELTSKGVTVQKIHTPYTLSSNQFRAFYIKIDDGTLKFGKEGDSTPLISYSSADFRLLNYYYLYLSTGARIRYCPALVEGLTYQKPIHHPTVFD